MRRLIPVRARSVSKNMTQPHFSYVQFTVQPAPGAELPVAGRANVAITYAWSVPLLEGETIDQVTRSVRLEPDAQLEGSVRFDNASTAQMQIGVLAADDWTLLREKIYIEPASLQRRSRGRRRRAELKSPTN